MPATARIASTTALAFERNRGVAGAGLVPVDIDGIPGGVAGTEANGFHGGDGRLRGRDDLRSNDRNIEQQAGQAGTDEDPGDIPTGWAVVVERHGS
jgi:hypothetical protein